MTAALLNAILIENPRGYASQVVERLEHALSGNTPAEPDPRHPHMFLLDSGRDHFYIAPLPTGKVVLLAHWR